MDNQKDKEGTSQMHGSGRQVKHTVRKEGAIRETTDVAHEKNRNAETSVHTGAPAEGIPALTPSTPAGHQHLPVHTDKPLTVATLILAFITLVLVIQTHCDATE